jgi:phenylacetate-CoA ligase
MRELILSTYHLSEKTARDYIEAIIKYNVKAIVGYPSAVSFLARICLSLGQSLSLKAVLTSSETLTALTRKTISTAFGCPVYDFYGSAERTCYVFTCEEGSYHIQPEYGYTELIPTDEAGQCKVVSTGFWNPAMPFIRYELGDIVVSSHEVCPCGRQFPVVREIMGRQADVIRTPSGRQFGAAILTHLLYGVDNIVESQIVQQAIDRITIKYVRGPSFSQQDLENLKRLVAKHLPQELAVDFEEVSSIEKTSSGKLKPVVSRISGYSSVC